MENKNNILNNDLKRGILLILIANSVNLFISLANGFVLPKYLSLGSYAELKIFQLYINYVGVLHFGYSDGLYLNYGGKKFTSINNKEINIIKSNLLVFQVFVTIIGIVFSIIANNSILLASSLCILPLNVVATYKSIFQATGEFDIYSKLLNYTSLITIIGTIFLLIVLKIDISIYYIGWTVIVCFIIWIMVERKMQRIYSLKFKFSFDLNSLVRNTKLGFVLMLGNFSSVMMTSIDRWFVKELLTVSDFAHYSFVVSVENIIAIFITPIVTTMYNYICINDKIDSIKKIRQMCIVFAIFLISAAFPAKFILEIYLTKYLESHRILFILFSTEIFYLLIKGIYVNIYKARKQQSLYFKQLIAVVIIGIVLNYIAYLITPTNESIAIATLLSIAIWYVVCCVSVKEIMPSWNENLIIVIVIPLFIILGCKLPALFGFVIYIVAITVLSLVFARDGLYLMINSVLRIFLNNTKVLKE